MKIPRIFTKWLLLLVLLAYAVGMAAWAASQVHGRACEGLRVEVVTAPGAPAFLSPKAVERELGDIPARAKGLPLSAINTDALERHLLSVNNFELAQCAISSEGLLTVRVVPIVPEARVFTPAGTYYINKDGKRLDAHAEYFVNLPVIRGNFTQKMPARGALPVAKYIAADSLLSSLITMIDYKSPSNILLIPRIRGHVINIGDTTDLPRKFANLLLFYRKVMPHKGWAAYDTISVKFRGQVVATRADKRRRSHSTSFEDPDPDPEEATAVDQTRPLEEIPDPAPAPEQKPAEKQKPGSTERN